MSDSPLKKKAVRYALIAAVTAGVSIPVISQRLNAQDEPARAAEPQAAPAAAAKKKPAAAKGGEKAAGKAPAKAPAAEDETPQPQEAQVDPSTVIVKSGDVEVTAGEFNHFFSNLQPQAQIQILTQPDGRRRVAEELLQIRLLAREAERRKMDEQEKFRLQLTFAREQVLAQALANEVGGDAASAEKYFDQHKGDFDTLQARHILVSTRGSGEPGDPRQPRTDAQAKAKADEIRGRLKGGEDFAKVAKAESDDPGSKDKGGEYTFGRGMMVPEFENAAYALKVGELSQPIKTPFGYHLIQLQKRTPSTFEQVKAQVGGVRMKQLLEKLKADKTTYNHDFFGGPPAEGGESAAEPKDEPKESATGEEEADEQPEPQAKPKPKPKVQPKPQAKPKVEAEPEGEGEEAGGEK